MQRVCAYLITSSLPSNIKRLAFRLALWDVYRRRSLH